MKNRFYMMKDASFGTIPLRKDHGVWEVFLVRLKSGNHWGFPKGHKEAHESDLEAAKRELEEETSLHIQKVLFEKPLVEEYTFEKEGKKIGKTVCYHLALVEGKAQIQLGEILEGKWVLLSQAKAIVTYPSTKNLCDQVILLLKNIKMVRI
jgi:bis(5'-nucleosidyl)-tetraphosphatase